METLVFDYRDGGPVPAGNRPPALVGVVGSGNLEILVEAADLSGGARIEVVTAAVGFRPIWQAVMDDFFARHKPADLHISINDVGATPAVVSLRLDQAMDAFKAGETP
ncbi:malonate decarboxylase acyl carrier protein [Niveispirillum fermenti]|uniref:malonate decarboxylase acyl carrier protein n=1 Tax=Niveispirillum fermenti TaxID=1233113 RepID=UPI003A8C5917